jgi:hypothetical protein
VAPVRGLVDAVNRAGHAAAGEMGGEQASLHAFFVRHWGTRSGRHGPAVGNTACAGDTTARKMLEEIRRAIAMRRSTLVRYEAGQATPAEREAERGPSPKSFGAPASQK